MFSPEQYPSQEKVTLEQGLEQIDFVTIKYICAKILNKAGVEKERSEKISEDVIEKIEVRGFMSFF